MNIRKEGTYRPSSALRAPSSPTGGFAHKVAKLSERRHPAGWLGGILPPEAMGRTGAARCRPASRLEGGAPLPTLCAKPPQGEGSHDSNPLPPGEHGAKRRVRGRFLTD